MPDISGVIKRDDIDDDGGGGVAGGVGVGGV